jgi:conjugal transfer pilus assembly protein TraA
MNALQNARAFFATENGREWVKAFVLTVVLFALFLYASHAHAADGDEFAEAATKFETWVKGNLGKLAAFVALAVGSVVAAVKKDWSWFFGAIILSMGIGIMASVINASFTATI